MSQPQAVSQAVNQPRKPWAPRGQTYRGGFVPVRLSGGDPYAGDSSTTK